MKRHTVELTEYQISIIIEALDDYIDYWQEQSDRGVDVHQKMMDTSMMLETFFRAKLRKIGRG